MILTGSCDRSQHSAFITVRSAQKLMGMSDHLIATHSGAEGHTRRAGTLLALGTVQVGSLDSILDGLQGSGGVQVVPQSCVCFALGCPEGISQPKLLRLHTTDACLCDL